MTSIAGNATATYIPAGNCLTFGTQNMTGAEPALPGVSDSTDIQIPDSALWGDATYSTPLLGIVGSPQLMTFPGATGYSINIAKGVTQINVVFGVPVAQPANATTAIATNFQLTPADGKAFVPNMSWKTDTSNGFQFIFGNGANANDAYFEVKSSNAGAAKAYLPVVTINITTSGGLPADALLVFQLQYKPGSSQNFAIQGIYTSTKPAPGQLVGSTAACSSAGPSSSPGTAPVAQGPGTAPGTKPVAQGPGTAPGTKPVAQGPGTSPIAQGPGTAPTNNGPGADVPSDATPAWVIAVSVVAAVIVVLAIVLGVYFGVVNKRKNAKTPLLAKK